MSVDSLDKILEAARVGETTDCEFKSSRGGFPGSFWETYSAMANSEGGVIILGVREKDGDVLLDGLTPEQAVQHQKYFWDNVHNRNTVSANLLATHDVTIVELERTPQAHLEPTKIVTLELKIEALPRRRDGFTAEPDLVADEQGCDLAVAIILDDVRPQASAIFAIDDGAAGRAGVALVGSDQFQRVTQQFDMFVIDRGHTSDARADQAHRVVAAADAGLEHREIASLLLEIQAGQREQGFERSELFMAPP